jgi:hypothetical protein
MDSLSDVCADTKHLLKRIEKWAEAQQAVRLQGIRVAAIRRAKRETPLHGLLRARGIQDPEKWLNT